MAPITTDELVRAAPVALILYVYARIYLKGRKDRRRRIEKAAVNAEYNEPAEAAYEIDETEPGASLERSFQRRRDWKSERQRLLLHRYPQHLVAAPEGRWFHDATVRDDSKEKADRPGWKVYLSTALLTVLLVYGVPVLFSLVVDWFSRRQ